jgi:predicted enzyme related to lactoylglutathione lyase
LLTGVSPILLVTDFERSCAWWRDQVGFEVETLGDDFAIATRDSVLVFMALSPQPAVYWKIVEKMWNVYIRVDDVDALYAEVQERGAVIDYGLYDSRTGCASSGSATPTGTTSRSGSRAASADRVEA